MHRRLAMPGLLALFLLLLFANGALAAENSSPRMRALLVGCDFFVSQENTYPAAANNVQNLADALMNDSRGYLLIRQSAGTISTISALEDAVERAFYQATEDDISVFYISTHGILSEDGESAMLLLSDGTTEEQLDVRTLERIFRNVPGTKVLILDACHSGAFIGKGLSGGASRKPFSSPEYRVLCSAGGSEASWYWQGAAITSRMQAASYFATVLCSALGTQGDYAADINRDGNITLSEAYQYICNNYAVATPQVHPQNDDFVLFSYNPYAVSANGKSVTDIQFDSTLMTAGQSQVTFSFVVRREVKLYYQIVYFANGAWQFGRAETVPDDETGGGFVNKGYKMRNLALSTPGDASSGYALIQFITLEDGVPVLQGARLLCVEPASGDIALQVATDASLDPSMKIELSITVAHDAPCALTVQVMDAAGNMVHRICYEQPTRPQQLTPDASMFYWDGKLRDGTYAPQGEYTIVARTVVGGKMFSAQSQPFTLRYTKGEKGNK